MIHVVISYLSRTHHSLPLFSPSPSPSPRSLSIFLSLPLPPSPFLSLLLPPSPSLSLPLTPSPLPLPVLLLSLFSQTMLEDKLRNSDWESTCEAIEQAVARESYLLWLREQEQKTTDNVGESSRVKTKVIHVHFDLRNMSISLVLNDQQSFYIRHFHIIILPILFCGVKFQSIASLSSYSILHYSGASLFQALKSLTNIPNSCLYMHSVLEISFESVQQKHLDKTIFDQQVVNFVQKISAVPIYGL